MNRRLPLILAGGVALISGCGVSTNGAIQELGQQSSAADTSVGSTTGSGNLPSPPAGVARIDGVERGSLTGFAVDAYRAGGGTTQVTVAHQGEATGFQELCRGGIDMVDSARPISRAELASCRAHGLTPVQFNVASDAVVLATKAETDVGADCLSVPQVREMYRAGSPLYDWSQLGFEHAPLTVSGPAPSNNVFSFFGRDVLGAAQPSLTDLRSDYRAGATDGDSRRFITGNPADVAVAAQRELLSEKVTSETTQSHSAVVSHDAATRELTAAAADQRKGIKDHRSAADRAKASARLAAARRAEHRAQIYVDQTSRALAAGKRSAALAADATRRQSALRGRISYFRFSYYELFEEQLRPLEVSTQTGAGRSCVFPSQETITDGTYPLARQLLITATTAGIRRSEVQSFLLSYLRRARQTATDHRLVPLTETKLAQEQAWLTGDQRPTIVVDPSAPATVKATS